MDAKRARKTSKSKRAAAVRETWDKLLAPQIERAAAGGLTQTEIHAFWVDDSEFVSAIADSLKKRGFSASVRRRKADSDLWSFAADWKTYLLISWREEAQETAETTGGAR